MANFTLHNVKAVETEARDHDRFCTLHLNITSQSKYDNEPVYDRLELYFDTIDEREQFIVQIANLLMPQ